MSATDDPIIRRRHNSSIDLDHYDRIARDLRARDQRTALKRLIAPVSWRLGTLWSQSPRARSFFGS